MLKFVLLALLCLTAHVRADVTLPGDLFYPGSITVDDSSGNSHATWVKICLVSYSAKNEVMGNSLNRCTSHHINETVHLPGGVYFLRIDKETDDKDGVENHSRALVTLQEGQPLVVPLVSQPISRSNGEFNISLFRDLTNPSEVDRFLQIKWAEGLQGTYSLYQYFTSADYYCRKKKMRATEVQACRAFKAKDYKGLSGAFRFNKDGSYSKIYIQNYVDEYNKLDPESYDDGYFEPEVRNLRDGDSIAVFAGTFGARFQNSVSYDSTTLGIDFH
jgi:hypothetical protein